MEGTRKQLINLLFQHRDRYVSGQELSEVLSISRSAVWKHMNELKKSGYEIEAVTNRGYRIINVPEALSEDAIRWGLETKWLGSTLHYHPTVTSTQNLAHEFARDGAEHGTVVIASEQTKGKGRMKRYWDSKAKVGLWFSTVLRPHSLEPKNATQITLVAAVALANVMKEYGIPVSIKWPNDLFIGDKKMAGILTEMQAEQDQIDYIIIGIGMNVNHEEVDFGSTVLEHATSLKVYTHDHYNLNTLFKSIAHEFEVQYERFIEHGFKPIKSDWEGYAYKMGEWLTVRAQGEWNAKLIGIHEDGALKVVDEKGQEHLLYSAEILWS
ncbi:biotin--[acetyl-CoA-carboxylase] ligase [Alkalibacillus haloalkaliphilus]|uniref:biotin--[acetyl-CoA-carboxylase] ligase n=1 Tax=Alkalibacillus haloalkaliphilus TaxID=94136 RepID=UPI0029356EB0|nr:biotin--[acetyl-CoA-carboxylase] ligase [Alkalibacillus haloalkaliphilus]MDV2580809.1 biotin--[acetyl-CoA-carboxylase] ligase [Alkalibacillus haloalkaliphilus]